MNESRKLKSIFFVHHDYKDRDEIVTIEKTTWQWKIGQGEVQNIFFWSEILRDKVFFIFFVERETDLFFLGDVAVSRVNNIQKYNEERKKWWKAWVSFAFQERRH